MVTERLGGDGEEMNANSLKNDTSIKSFSFWHIISYNVQLNSLENHSKP